MNTKEQAIRDEYQQLQDQLAQPDIFSDKTYPKIAKRSGELAKTISLFDEIKKLQKQTAETEELAKSDDELGQLAKEELGSLQTNLQEAESNLSEMLTPKDPNDERDAILEIRAAAGGDEASLFASELYKMYARYGENKGYKLELISHRLL